MRVCTLGGPCITTSNERVVVEGPKVQALRIRRAWSKLVESCHKMHNKPRERFSSVVHAFKEEVSSTMYGLRFVILQLQGGKEVKIYRKEMDLSKFPSSQRSC